MFKVEIVCVFSIEPCDEHPPNADAWLIYVSDKQ